MTGAFLLLSPEEPIMSKLIDLGGKRFGRLVVLALHPERYRCGEQSGAQWLCVCDCGEKRIVRGGNLQSGNSTSCGCLTRENTSKATLVDMPIGQRFGRWTILAMCAERNRHGKVCWLCRCSCPARTERAVPGNTLRSGLSRSCGCIAREKTKKRLTTHGMTGTSIHNRWKAMKQRCYNPNARWYSNYGARGIGVCEDWLPDFQAYYADVGDVPSDGLTLDRINNDGNYQPDNVRWADRFVQAANQRPRKKRPRD